MKKKVIFAGLSLMSLLLLIACGEKKKKLNKRKVPKQPADNKSPVGKDAPDFTLQSMDGKRSPSYQIIRAKKSI